MLRRFIKWVKLKKKKENPVPKYYNLERVVTGINSKSDIPNLVYGNFITTPKLGENFHFFKETAANEYIQIYTGKVTSIRGNENNLIFTTISGSKYKLIAV
jgi:hypothetical protein